MSTMEWLAKKLEQTGFVDWAEAKGAERRQKDQELEDICAVLKTVHEIKQGKITAFPRLYKDRLQPSRFTKALEATHLAEHDYETKQANARLEYHVHALECGRIESALRFIDQCENDPRLDALYNTFSELIDGKVKHLVDPNNDRGTGRKVLSTLWNVRSGIKLSKTVEAIQNVFDPELESSTPADQIFARYAKNDESPDADTPIAQADKRQPGS